MRANGLPGIALLALLGNADAVVIERSLLTLAHLATSLSAAREVLLRSAALIAAPLASPHRSVQLAAARVLASLWCQEGLEGGGGTLPLRDRPPPISTHDPRGVRYAPRLHASYFSLTEFGLRGESSAAVLRLQLSVGAFAGDKAELRGLGTYGVNDDLRVEITGQVDTSHKGGISFTIISSDADSGSASATSFFGALFSRA